MAASQIISEDVDSWETLMCLYNSALKEVGTKLDILNDEFVHIHKYNPIEYIKKRIKTPESIVKKLKRDGYDVTVENMVNYINDIAGIRIVCSFTERSHRRIDQGLYQASQGERLQELSHACDHPDFLIRPCGGHEGGDPDPYDRDGFLGKFRA